jgi:hypothetical protein
LVGHHRQLPELAAGGTFRALARELAALRLTENRRQVQVWERGVLDELRAGDVAAAIETYAAPDASPSARPHRSSGPRWSARGGPRHGLAACETS